MKSQLSKQLAKIGAVGGSKKSKVKTAASRKNGKRGGRPAIEDEFSNIADRQLRYRLRSRKRPRDGQGE